MERNLSWVNNAFPVDPSARDVTTLQQAFNDFQKMIRLYPNSIYACDAQKRMIYIRNLLAKRELATAEFYFVRKAYVAAANRASYVVQHLPGTPQVPRALVIMVQSYRAMGELQLANETLEIIRINYPQELAKCGKV